MDGADIARITGSLLLIIVLILAAAWWLRRMGMLKTAEGPHIRVLSSCHVGARQQLLVVEVEGARLLLSANARQLALLHVLAPSPAAVAKNIPVAIGQPKVGAWSRSQSRPTSPPKPEQR
ncbi:flagellar biosynthetic protein FliO [Alcaligenaceae bacterium]|nr:flagellar biosynthetic protein FliO [Alcaligenaceae bacterium]